MTPEYDFAESDAETTIFSLTPTHAISGEFVELYHTLSGLQSW
jgi:hypothetical protein